MPYKVKIKWKGDKDYKFTKETFRTKKNAQSWVNRKRKSMRDMNRISKKHTAFNTRIVKVKTR